MTQMVVCDTFIHVVLPGQCSWFLWHKLERKLRQRNIPNRKLLGKEQMSGIGS